ncbi:MAG: hypothetical protein OEY38_07390 [Gammaproteobacteria bacterium]|nr:hypothetical protein [Gammaproteobacteria bacterium]
MTRNLFITVLATILVACSAKETEFEETLGGWKNPEGAAQQLSLEEYNRLPPDKQFMVVNNLLGTLYKGVPANEFFDLSKGMKPLTVASDKKNYFAQIATSLNISVPSGDYKPPVETAAGTATDNKDGLLNENQKQLEPVKNVGFYNFKMNQKNLFNDNLRQKGEPLALISTYPISRDAFDAWIAYRLANTILFSPAEEIDSTDSRDVDFVYSRLRTGLAQNKTISEIIYAHELSESNWRRFRSPEDNTREMIEIYLGLFDRDADVPKASVACKNWSLSDANDSVQGRYRLVIDDLNANTEPQQVLGQYVTTCEEFYALIANHPLVVPRMTNFIVDQFFPDYPVEKRAAIVDSILQTNPTTFQEVFAGIIFSKEYLLNNIRMYNYEEAYFGLGDRISLNRYERAIESKVNDDAGLSLARMGQPAFSLKLGRFKDQPANSQNFMAYFKSLRLEVFGLSNSITSTSVRDNGGNGSSNGGFWSRSFVESVYYDLNDEEFLDYVLMSLILRRATDEEKHAFLNKEDGLFLSIDNDRNFDSESELLNNRIAKAKVLMEYVLRLPELYYLGKGV